MPAPVFDAASSTSGAGVTSLTWAHTCSGSDRYLLVVGGGGDNPLTDVNITGVTFNGSATGWANIWEQNGPAWVNNEGWGLVGPAAVTANIVVTYGGAALQACAGACSYTGVDATTPLGTPNKAAGNGTIASVAVASAVGELVVGGISSDSETGLGGITIVSGTSRWEIENVGSDTAYSQGEWTGAASVTVRWNQAAENWAVGGVSLKPIGGSSPQTLAAGANTVTITAPAVALLTTVALAAGANTVNITAPTASLGLSTTVAAGANTVTVTAPTATVQSPVTLGAGTNTVVITAPTATIPGTVSTLSAGVATVIIIAPNATLLATSTLNAGQNTVTVTAPIASLISGGVTLQAGQNTVFITAPLATLQGTGVVTDTFWCANTGMSAMSGGGDIEELD